MVYRQVEHYRLKPRRSLEGNILGAKKIMSSRTVTDEALTEAVALITHAEQVHTAYGTPLPLEYPGIRRQIYEACIVRNINKARAIADNGFVDRFGAARAHLQSVSSYCKKLGIPVPEGFGELERKVQISD